MKFVSAVVRVVILINLTLLVWGINAESSKSSSSHKPRPKRYDEDGPTEQVYYVDQIASDSEISPWTSNRIIAKTTENGKQSQYIINVSPDDEVIIHERGANDRNSNQESAKHQSPQDFVQQALRMRDQYKKGSSIKASTPGPASSFAEYTTDKYDHFGPSKSPPSAAQYGKPVPPKVHHTSAHQDPVNYRPKHMKPNPTKLPVNSVTPFSDVELPEAETTSPYRKEKAKDQHKSPKHISIKQQDTAASSIYIQKVKPIDPVYTSYNTHHDTGSSFKEYQQLPVTDSHGSSSVISIQKVKPPTDTHAKHKPSFPHEEDSFFEKKHRKHTTSDEVRYKPKHMASHDHVAKEENIPEFYTEKIRHTVERHPIKYYKEESSTADPFSKYYQTKPYESLKSPTKYEQEASSPSMEPYRYQPPKSYPPEESAKFKFSKDISTTAEPYKPYNQIKVYTENKSKYQETNANYPSPRPHHKEYSNEKPTFHTESYHHTPSKARPEEFAKPDNYRPNRPEQIHKGQHESLTAAPSRAPKYYEEPSRAPSYAKVTTYPTPNTSNSPQNYHRAKAPAYDPYKFQPSPTPEISISSHGFQKPTPPNYPKYIPTKMPEHDETKTSFKTVYPSPEPISNYIPSSTQESFSPSPEFPKVFSLAATTYSPKYPVSPTPDSFDFAHMSEAPKSFSKYTEPTPSTKVYGTINPSEQPFKTLSTKIIMKPSPTELSTTDPKDSSSKSLQNRTTHVEFSPSPTEEAKTEYYTNPDLTTYYVFANGTEIKLGSDPSKIPPELRVSPGDASYLSSNYSTKLAEDFAMKYYWDSIPSPTKNGDFFISPETALKEGKLRDPSEYILREKKKGKPVLKSLKPIKTLTIYRNTHRSGDDTEMEGGFEPSNHYSTQEGIPQISDKRGEVTDDDEDFFFANGEVILQDDPNKATKKNAFFLPPGLNQPAPEMMLKLTPQPQTQNLQDQQLPDMDMSAEPSKKHQYFVLYHIEDNKKKPTKPPTTTTQAPPPPPPVKQEIHYHYTEKENEDPEVTHEHFNYHHEQTIEDADDDIQHHYVNPNIGKYNFRPNIAHPSFKGRDSFGSGSEANVRVVDPVSKLGRPVEITKQEYMRHVQNAVLKYMKQLQDEGRLPAIVSRDREPDETQKTFDELDISALLNENNAKHKFQLGTPVKVNLPINPSQYKPMKTVPSTSTYRPITNVKIPKNVYPAGKPLKIAIESLQEQLGNSVDLTVKGTKGLTKPDLSTIDVGQSYLHGPNYDPPIPQKTVGSSFDAQSVVHIPAQKTKLHFNQQTYHDINSLTNLKETQNLKPSSPYSSIKGGMANVGASISFGGNNKAGPQVDDHKLGPEALDAPIQIINGIPITNPYNIDINTLRYMLGGIAQAQVEQQQQQTKQQEPTIKFKGSNWMSLPTVSNPQQIFSSNMPTFQHSPSEANNYKYNANFDSSNFKIKIPKNVKDFKMKPINSDSLGSAAMNYASWGEPLRQNRQVAPQQHQHQQHQHPQYHHPQSHPHQQQQLQQQQQQQHQQQIRPNREFNPELFLNPHGQFNGPIMKKKNGPLDRKSTLSKPSPVSTVKASNLDTNLRPPPPR
ncbi:uncharacterized protein LOC131680772 [Topomyia yanbarensis]|uniref:uncharacterized protein LOC131680772 n=1 Tax=Topomyia yanbarensis TaxID=2498891 RepID=UPI00273B4AE7|nr:uncharacterized protein LOC131680772 [Topomyia yanbarensis]